MSSLTDNLFIDHLSLFIDLIKYQIDNPNEKVFDKKIDFGRNIITEIEELMLYINGLSHTEYRKYVNEINDYLTNVTVSQFMIDYIRCRCGIIIDLDSIYKYNKKNKNMVNYKKHIITTIKFNDYILSDKNLYVVSFDKKYIEPSIDDINEFTIDFLNEKLTVENTGNKNIFWTMYYLFEKHQRNLLLFAVKQKIYDMKLLYNDLNNIHTSSMSNLVNSLSVLKMITFDGYSDEQKYNDIKILHKLSQYNDISLDELANIFGLSDKYKKILNEK